MSDSEQRGQQEQSRVAMFIDAENLIIEAQKAALPFRVELLMNRIREEGRLVLARAYADWSVDPSVYHIQSLHEHTVEMVMLSTKHKGKNTADIQMVVDALELTILPNSPDVIAIVAGDRDFVPLVQRIKRYGKNVIGLGMRGSTSAALERACTRFVYYEDLFPKEQDTSGVSQKSSTTSLADVADVKQGVDKRLLRPFGLLVRATHAVLRKEPPREPTGANLRPFMQQLDPTFSHEAYGFDKFKEFVEAAHSAGFVAMRPSSASKLDFAVEPLVAEDSLQQEEPAESGDSQLSFDNEENALRSYRRILEAKGVPLIPWDERQLLVKHLTEECKQRTSLTIADATDIFRDAAARNYLRIPERALQKLSHTMNIAQVFALGGRPQRIQDFMHEQVTLAFDADDILKRINIAYVNGIKLDYRDAALRTDAMARLLFGSSLDSDKQRATVVLEEAESIRRGY